MTFKNLDIEQILNLNPLPSWIYDLKTQKIHHVNSVAIELYQYTKSEFLSLSNSDLQHPEEKNNILLDLESQKHEIGKINFGIFSHQKKSGELVRIEINGQKVNFDDKECFLIVAIDVTEKEAQIKSLKIFEKKLNVISSIAKVGYWKLNLSTNKLSWSDEIYKIFGKSKETFEVSYENFLLTIFPDDLKSFEKNQKLALLDKIPLNHIHRIIVDGNKIRWVHEIGNLLRDESGKPIEFEGTVQDITQHKEEEERLKLMESVVTNATDCVLITEAEPFDEPGPKIIYVNDAFTKITGYTAEEVIGKIPRILQGPKSNKKELARLGKDIREWKSSNLTIVNYKKNGEEFWNNFSLTPVANSKGWFTHWISIERDVTEQKKLEFEKELLNKLSYCFNEEEELKDASKKLCKEISDYGNFDLVEIWCPNLEQNLIQLIASHAKDESFYDAFDDVDSLKKGIGMPGNIWEKSISLLWDEREINDFSVRKEGAKNTGLKSILGLPLEFKNEIVGVMLIGTSKKGSLINYHLKTTQKLEKFIASEIYRKILEKDLKQVYNTIPDILCVMDFSGRFLKINEAGCDLLGFSLDEIKYESLQKFIHPEDQEKVANELKKLGEGKINYQFENRFITKNEKIIWLNWHCTSDLKDKLIFSAAKDVTEEKKLKELNRSTSVLSKIGFWEIDLENSKLYWSDLVYELHETDPENFIPNLENGINLYREDFRQMVREKIAHAIETGEGYDFEAIKITKKLNERWFRSIANVEQLNGVTKRIYGSFQDIHDRKEYELRLASFTNNLPGVAFQYIVHPDGKDSIINVTKGATKVWGLKPDEVVKNSNLIWDQILQGGDYDKLKQSIKESIQNKSDWSFRWSHVLPNGELRVNAGYGTPKFLIDGTVIYNSLILDVTKETKTEELLQQTSELAKIGSWELDLVSDTEFNMYWSLMTKKIIEVDDDYDPIKTAGVEFISKQSLEEIKKALKELFEIGTEFDKELLIITPTGKEKWLRSIGKSERRNGKCRKIFGSVQDIHIQKVNEIALQKSLKTLEDYKFALDQSASITIADANGFIISVNDQFCNLSKYSKEELIGNTHKLINSKYHSKAFFAELWDTITAGKVWRGEVKNRAKDGSYYWADITVVPFLDKNNKPFQYVAIRIDITSKKLANEKAIKILEEKNDILESISDGFYAVDKQWIVTYWNKKAEEINNLKRENIVGKHFWEIFKDAQDTDFYKNNQIAMLTGVSTNYEEYYNTLDKWFEVTVYPSESGLSAYFKDITQKKKSEIELIEANERFEKVAEATTDAIYDWGIINDTHYWGIGFETILGYDLNNENPATRLWTNQIHEEDVERVKKSLYKSIDNPKILKWAEEYRFIKKDGATVFVIDKGIFIRDHQGKALRMVGAITDLTKQKNQELELKALNESLKNYTSELERSNKELEQFAFITSHDLQEPLRMITSFMDQLKRKYENQLDEKALLYINYATDGAKRMKQIILDLLQYSRANRPTEDLENVDLNEVLSSFKELRRQVIAEKSVIIKSDTLPILNTYKAVFIHIFHGLIDNAIKYSKANVPPIIDIKVTENEFDWEFSFSDNGIGIDAQFFDKIFVLFQRLHNKTEFDGTGIGLSIVKRSVEFLGGKIWLTSKVGEGTTFYFTIKK